ncbi:MAG: hypothetical protein HQ541_23255, partial [Mariniphaga sp.]|nr:hypothetical protein [Mariniphaga sp.]
MKDILKYTLLVLIVALFFQCKKEDFQPVVEIPDDNFLNALIEQGVDKNGDGIISPEEAEAVTYLDISGTYDTTRIITNIQGIEAFTNLDTFKCSSNQITSLDVSNNFALEWLDCGENNLTSLDVSKNIALTGLRCSGNQLTSLDVSN